MYQYPSNIKCAFKLFHFAITSKIEINIVMSSYPINSGCYMIVGHAFERGIIHRHPVGDRSLFPKPVYSLFEGVGSRGDLDVSSIPLVFIRCWCIQLTWT